MNCFKGDAAEIRWSLLSPDEIRQMSVVEVKNPTIYDASTLPKENGVNDHRMGTVDRRYPCGTCFHKVETDDGHPGHMELSAPVYHIGFIKSICKILRSVCFFCSKICLKDEYFDGFPITKTTTTSKTENEQDATEPETAEIKEDEDPEDAEDLEDLDTKIEEDDNDTKIMEDDADDEQEQSEEEGPIEEEEELPEVPIEDDAAANAEEQDDTVPEDDLNADLNAEIDEEVVVDETGDEEIPEDTEEDTETKKRKKRKTNAAKKKKGAGKKFQVLKFKKWFDATEGAKFSKDRFRLVTDFVGKMKTPCPHCKGPRPVYSIQNGIFIRQTWKIEFDNEEERKFCKKMFTPFEARSVLTNLSAIDCKRLGLESRPEYAVSSVLLVPSPVIRPSIAFGDSNRTRGQDDLTNKLQDILKTSLDLKRMMESKTTTGDFVWNDDIKKDPLKTYFMLQFHVATYIDNNIPGQRQSLKRNKIPVKSIKQRFVGKGGRIRGNLQGKRVDLSARAPISPDMDQDMTYVGVPREIAETLTITETVTALNIHALTKRVQIGRKFPDGAKFVIKTKCAETALEDIIEGKLSMDALNSHLSNNNDKSRKRSQQGQYAGKNQNDEDLTIDLQFCQQKHLLRLQYGWKVLRYLQNDDQILVNRQPSLRKKSILVHKVRIIEGRTIRLNLSVCANYNADFDGDEMNLHLCQDFLSRAEYEIMTVSKQLLNAQNNRPGMGLVFDPLLGSYLLTRRDQMFNREQTMNLLNTKKHDPVWNLPIPAILKPVQLWTGKQIFSALFPDDTNVTIDRRPKNKKSDSLFRDLQKNYSTEEQFIHIRQGELLCGQLATRELGATAGGIIHVICKDHDSDLACHFIDNAQSMTNYFLAQEGFGVGISDCMMSEENTKQVHALVDLTYQQLSTLYEKAAAIGISAEKLEPTVSRLLGNVLEMTGAVAQKSLTEENGFVVMKNAGSKGSSINLSQIMACVGQNSIDGRRISLGSKRPLPCFDGNSEIFESHGFIENSYVRGLTAAEFFYHTMAGREGLSDTAVKTARTGYLQRRLMKSHESVKIVYDQTIRNAENYITSYIYGDDGLDASFLEPVHLSILTWSNTKIKEYYDPEIYEIMIKLRDECRFAKITPMTQELNVTVFLPIHLERLLQIFHDKFRSSESMTNDTKQTESLDAKYLHSQLHKLSNEFSSKYGMYPHATLFFRTSLFMELTTRRLIYNWKWSKEQFDQLIAKIESKFWSCLVQPGEMVGPLAAESIGEPSTQMTLNTFHHAGIASKNVILGVPRITELVDACRKIKTPSLSIYLLKANDKTIADELKEQLLELFLQDVVLSKDVFYDPNLEKTVIKEDQDLVDWFNIFKEEKEEVKNVNSDDKKERKKKNNNNQDPSSNFVIRLKLDRKLLVKRKLTAQIISDRIADYFNAEFSEVRVEILYSDSNVLPPNDWILRIRCYNLDTLKLLQEEKRGSGRRSVIQTIVQNSAASLLIPAGGGKKNASNLKPELIQLACHNLLHKIMAKIRISKVPNIKQATLRKVQVSKVDRESHAMITDDEFMIDTVGSALLEVMTLPGVDWKRTMSNDVNEVYETMGIEMAAALLFHEMKTVLSYDGTYINDRHIILIVNTMTFRGYLMPLSRHGINRIDTGPLVRGSFEETPDVLLEAGFFHEVDYISGVTDNITLGQKAPIGTGCVSVHLTKEYIQILKDKIEKTKELAIQQGKKWNRNEKQRIGVPKLIRTRFDRHIPTVDRKVNEDYAHRSPEIKPVFIALPALPPEKSLQTKPNINSKQQQQQQQPLAFSSKQDSKLPTVTHSFSSILAQGYPLASAQDRLRRLQSNYIYRPSSPDLTPFQPFPIDSHQQQQQQQQQQVVHPVGQQDLDFDLSRMLIDIAPHLPKEVTDFETPTIISGTSSSSSVPSEPAAAVGQPAKIQLYNETTGRINPACVQWLCSGEKD